VDRVSLRQTYLTLTTELSAASLSKGSTVWTPCAA
jgi:hypothetical protein